MHNEQITIIDICGKKQKRAVHLANTKIRN